MIDEMPATVIPPDLLDAERAVVAHAIGSREGAEAVREIVRPSHFLRPAHSVMVAAAVRLAEDAGDVDPVLVLTELVRTGDIRALSQPDYIHDVYAVRTPLWAAHARRVRQEHGRRAFARILHSSLQESADPGFDFDTALERLRDGMDALEVPDGIRPLRSMGELVAEVITALETEIDHGIPSPWRDLNDVIYGIKPGQVCIVAAEPGGGKSIIGAQWAAHAATELSVPVLLASLEMPAEDLTTRLISAKAGVSLSSITHHELTDGDWARLAKYSGDVANSLLTIDDDSTMSLAHIRSRLRGMRRTAPAQMLVVDYLVLLQPPEGTESRRVGIAELSKGLKQIAREFGIPVIVLAQLTRDSSKQRRKPTMRDLAESSQIEADADLVLLLHHAPADDAEHAGEVEVIVDKNRHGPKTTIALTFQGHYGRCVDLSRQWTSTTCLDGDRR